MLQKGLKLYELLEKGDYSSFNTEVQKLNILEQNGLWKELITVLSGSFTNESCIDREKALEILLILSTPEIRAMTCAEIAIESKFDSLTSILLHALSNDFYLLNEETKEIIRSNVLVRVEREMMKELDEEELMDNIEMDSIIDNRLNEWMKFSYSISAQYPLRSCVNLRGYRSCTPSIIQYLIRYDPLSPLVIAKNKQPFVYSPQYAFSILNGGMRLYLNRKSITERRSYLDIILNVTPYLGGLLKVKEESRHLHLIEELFTSLIPILSHYHIGESRNEIVKSFINLLLSLPKSDQPLIIKRLIRMIKDGLMKVDAEAQVLSFLVDLYRQQLVVRGVVQYNYSSCLGDLWGNLYIKYEDPSEACMFYQSIFLLAGLQARVRLRIGLLKDVHSKILKPLHDQLSDYTQLRRLQESAELGGTKMNLPFLPHIEDDSALRLHISTTIMNETSQLITQLLKENTMN